MKQKTEQWGVGVRIGSTEIEKGARGWVGEAYKGLGSKSEGEDRLSPAAGLL